MQAEHELGRALRGTTLRDPAVGRLWRARRVGRLVRAAEPAVFVLPVAALALTVYGHRIGVPESLTGPLWGVVGVVVVLVFCASRWVERQERKGRQELYPRLRSAMAGLGDELDEWQLSRRGPEWLISMSRRHGEVRWELVYGREAATLTELPDAVPDR